MSSLQLQTILYSYSSKHLAFCNSYISSGMMFNINNFLEIQLIPTTNYLYGLSYFSSYRLLLFIKCSVINRPVFYFWIYYAHLPYILVFLYILYIFYLNYLSSLQLQTNIHITFFLPGDYYFLNYYYIYFKVLIFNCCIFLLFFLLT